jgi:hypothetical protein
MLRQDGVYDREVSGDPCGLGGKPGFTQPVELVGERVGAVIVVG